MKDSTRKILKETIGVIIGSIIMGLGINMFFVQHTIAPGGLSGAGIVVNKLTDRARDWEGNSQHRLNSFRLRKSVTGVATT